MGRITTNITIANVIAPNDSIQCKALVDTRTAFLSLPSARKSRLGKLDSLGNVKVELGNQTITDAEVWGPVKLQIDGCRTIHTEVLFIDMEPQDGQFQPFLDYIPMEQSQLSVDMASERLVPVPYVDLK
jgi:hypothetical protein